MKIKTIMQIVLLALIVALPMVVAFDGKVTKENDIKVKDIDTVEEELMTKIPETYEQTVTKIEVTDTNIVPIPHRYLMWTHDGLHIMWGTYRNGFFVGTDNLGKRAWGIYGKKVFAGFYDGEFFWGKYGSGRWKAFGLFDLERSHGKYVLFPGKMQVIAKPIVK